MPTPSMEDYLEKIYQLETARGFARVSDIAEQLNVQPPSVTRMLQRLRADEYVFYERYRGAWLTPKGRKIGARLVSRHEKLEQFLKIIGVDAENIYREVEGIEHHFSKQTMSCIEALVTLFENQPELVQQLEQLQKEQSQ